MLKDELCQILSNHSLVLECLNTWPLYHIIPYRILPINPSYNFSLSVSCYLMVM